MKSDTRKALLVQMHPPVPRLWVQETMTFLNPLNTLIPKIPFSGFSEFWVWVSSRGQGSVSVGFWGGGGAVN